MTDKIYIRDLLLRAIVGIYQEERREQQDVVINIILDVDMRKAAETDNIDDAVNYKAVKKSIIKLVEASSFCLIEKLGSEIARVCLSFKDVERATVTIDKPGALRFARSVAIEISRTRDDFK